MIVSDPFHREHKSFFGHHISTENCVQVGTRVKGFISFSGPDIGEMKMAPELRIGECHGGISAGLTRRGPRSTLQDNQPLEQKLGRIR